MFKKYQIKNYRFRLIAYVVLLCIIGILAIGSAKESVQGKQIIGMVAGLILMAVFSLIDYNLVLKFRRVWYVMILVLLGVLLIPGVGHEVGGATRWIVIGGDNGLQFQPSELCKILLIVFFAAYFMRHHDRINTWKVLLMSVVLAAIPIFMIFREPDLSTTIVTLLVFIVMLYMSGLSYKIIVPILAVCVPSVIVSLILMLQEKFPFLEPYQYSRILSWINPDKYPDYARQQTNSIIAIGSGQLWGKGLNNSSITSLKNGNYISEPQTDFIFTVVGEELGFAGCVIVIVLTALVVFDCLWIAKNAKDFGGRLLACGIASLIGFQAFINMGVATGILPNTGIPLPFVSYGLTSLVSMFIGIGLVLNVGLQTDRRGTGTGETETEKGLHF